MFGRETDRIADAARVLVAIAATAADPTFLTALTTGPAALDAMKRLVTAPPPAVREVGDKLAARARELFAATQDVPADAAILYPQMVVAGAVSAEDIVAAGMNAEALKV